MKKQAGFTLIELVMVIVILGVLAAVALPKFSDLAGEARVAKIKAMKGAMQSAAVMAHGMQLAKGVGSDQPVSVDGGTAVTMANGWPTANTAGIKAAIDTTGYDAGGDDGVVAADDSHTGCKTTYVASNAGAQPTFTDAFAAADCK